MDIYGKSLELHEKYHGKLKVEEKIKIESKSDLALVYTPGVAAVCKEIEADPESLYKYTIKSNTVAVVTDGSAVLGLGNIGPAAGLPVMEGKCMLFKRFAGIDAFPVCIKSQSTDDFIETVKKISAPFGGINLEDIAAPQCFEIEKRLRQEMDIPVFHDDQHGTAVVVLAALINALEVSGRTKENSRIVISGAGAAGTSIAQLLLKYGFIDISVCDRKGIIFRERDDIKDNIAKTELAMQTNPLNLKGGLAEAIKNSDIFIGVSAPGILEKELIGTMNEKPIIFALANPEPEIDPEAARIAGAFIVGTGRSDFPNQINNALAFPGIFRAMLDLKIRQYTDEILIRTAEAIASCVKNHALDKIVPSLFESDLSKAITEAINQLS